LYTLALSVTRCPELAEDAVHEGFTRLCRLTPDPQGDPVAYTFAVVRHAAIDMLRRGPSPPPLEAPIFDGHARSPSSEAIEAEEAARAQRAVDGLGSDQQELIVLKLYAGLTFEQIAETLGEPLGTVTSRYHRTMRQLRETLESES
jgi:RNA polymerase sigma-70 factor (ECF subfamily)